MVTVKFSVSLNVIIMSGLNPTPNLCQSQTLAEIIRSGVHPK